MRGSNICVCRLSFDDSDSDSEPYEPGKLTAQNAGAMDVEGAEPSILSLSARQTFHDSDDYMYSRPSRRVPHSAPSHKRRSPQKARLKKEEGDEEGNFIFTTTPTKKFTMPLPQFEAFSDMDFDDDTVPMERDANSRTTPQLVRKTRTPIRKIKCPDTPVRKPTFSRIAPQTVSHPRHFYVSMAHTGERLGMTLSDLDVQEKVGEGSFGVVFKAFHAKTNTIYALKKSKRYIPYKNVCFNLSVCDKNIDLTDDSKTNESGDPRAHLREVDLAMSASGHPNIVRIIQAWEESDRHLYILSEFCEFSLSGIIEDQWTHRGEAFSEPQILCFAADMFCGVAYLHELGIMHMDLKPENILVKRGVPRDVLKIGDFGIAFRKGDSRRCAPTSGDNRYMAPELLDDVYDFCADVFSLGITLYEVSHPGIVLPTNGERWKALRSNDIDFGIWKYSNELKELIVAMLNSDYTKRPTAQQLATCPLVVPYITK